VGFGGSIVKKDVARNTTDSFFETKQEESDLMGKSLIIVAQSAQAESVRQ